jgi:hypothetical protein
LSFLKNELFLSKAERDYLLGKDQASHDYVCVKSRLNKKLKVFVDQELPLLLGNGYLSDIAEFRNIAVIRNTSKALVAQPGRGLPLIECKNGKKESLGGDLDPRPLPLGSRLFEPYLTKVTLYQAELPRQLNEQSNQ